MTDIPTSQTVELVQSLFRIAPRDHFVERRAIYTDGRVDQLFHQLETLREQPQLWAASLFSEIFDGKANVYYSVASRQKASLRANSVGVALTAYADFDDEEAVHEFAIPPSAVVQTSPSNRKYQTYWFLDEASPDLDLLLAICRAIPNSDLNAVDAARVLRAPGFQNLKYEHRPRAKMIRLNTDRRYQLDELARAFPPAARQPKSFRRTPTSRELLKRQLIFDAIVEHLFQAGCNPRYRSDGGVIALCPLHEDTNPSLSVHPEWGWHCFAGCANRVGGAGRLSRLANHLGVRVR